MNSVSLDERMDLDRDATMSRFVEVVALLLKIRSKAYATALYLDHLIVYASNTYNTP